MKKTIIKKGLLIVSILAIFFAVWYSLQKQEGSDYQREGRSLIDKIETFRQTEHRLPNSVKELGLEEPMNNGPYYEKKDSINYIVFFAVGFDETYIYYSDKNEWKKEH